MSWYHSYFFCHIIARNYSYLLLVYRCTKEWQLKKYKRLTFPSSVQSLWAVQNSEQIQNYRKGVSSTLSKGPATRPVGREHWLWPFWDQHPLKNEPPGQEGSLQHERRGQNSGRGRGCVSLQAAWLLPTGTPPGLRAKLTSLGTQVPALCLLYLLTVIS